jgi:hypothetical protein
MNIHIRRRRDTFIRMKAFSLEFPEDFPAESVEAEQIAEISAVLDQIEQAAGEQASGIGKTSFTYHGKGTNRINLRDQMDDISTIADTLAYSIEGVDLLFKIQKNLSDAGLIALAAAFIERAEPYKEKFIRYGLKTTFIADLQAAKQAFEDSLTAPEAASEAKVEATAKLDQEVRRGMIARSILNGLMKIKYKTNAARMRAWQSASHIDRDNKNDDDDDSETPAN